MAGILVLKLAVELFWNVQPESLKNILKGKPGLLRLHCSACCQWYSCNICEVWTVGCACRRLAGAEGLSPGKGMQILISSLRQPLCVFLVSHETSDILYRTNLDTSVPCAKHYP